MSKTKQQSTKVYVPSTFANVKSFDGGGEIYNIDFIDANELIDFIKKNSTDNKFRIQVQKQRNDPSKASVTLNTWVPSTANRTDQVVITDDDGGGDGLPF